MKKLSVASVLAWGIVVAVIAGHAAINIYWMGKDNSYAEVPPCGGQLNIQAVCYYTAKHIFSLPLSWFDRLRLLSIRVVANPLLSPAFYVVGWLSQLIAGEGITVLLLSNLFWLSLLLGGVFLTARYAYGRWVGVLALVLTALFPAIYGLSRRYGNELPLASLVVLAIYMVLRGRDFKTRWSGWLTGIAISAGVLIDSSCVVYVVIPLASCAWRNWRRFSRQKVAHRLRPRGEEVFLQRGQRLLTALAITIGCLLLRADQSRVFWHVYMRDLAHTITRQNGVVLLEHLYYYVEGFINGLTPELALTAGIAAVLGGWASRRRAAVILTGWSALPFLFFALTPAGTPLNIVPVFPAVALIAAAGIWAISRPLLRCLVIGFVALNSVAVLAQGSFETNNNAFNNALGAWGVRSPQQVDYPAAFKELLGEIPLPRSLQMIIVDGAAFWGDETIGIPYLRGKNCFPERIFDPAKVAVYYYPDPWYGLRAQYPFNVDYAAARFLPRFLVIEGHASPPSAQVLDEKYIFKKDAPSGIPGLQFFLFERKPDVSE